MVPNELFTSWLLVAVVCRTVIALESLDTYQPILRVSPATDTQDRFGFAVTAHQKTSNASDFTHLQALEDVLIIVGAPYGRYPGGIDLPLNRSICQQTGNYTDEELAGLTDSQISLCYQRTGLVYQCPLVGGGGCSGVLGNGNENGVDGTLFDRQGTVQEQNRTNQLMGYTLLSSGDYFIACAPLWKSVMIGFGNVISEILPHGRCVLSGRNLTDFSYVRPCRSSTGSSASQINDGYCTAGFGLAISKDGNQSRLAVGAIGLDNSRGGVFYYDELNNPISDELSSSQKTTPPGTTDYASTFYGYTTAAGNFDGSKNNENFFVSAPRFNSQTNVGQVYAMENITEFPTLTQQGDQFGEYFGYSMAVADLNGDGYDDLVVGAPFYSEQSAREIGRVIILYNNKGQGLVRNATIVGKTASGRFGHSLASLGDLNNDGFEDFAVGAPYENGGTVYVYYGKNSSDDNVIVNTIEQQVITAENMVSQLANLTNLTSFGYTLNGGVDVDNNKYRDLIVGAYESQAVFVLRSVPVANVDLEINNHVQDVNFRNKSCVLNTGPVACFDFSICGRFTGRGLESFVANFTLREEVIDANSKRLFFDPNDNESSVFRDSLSLPGPAVRTCNTYTAYIRNDSSNTLGSLSFTVTMDQFDRSSPPVTINHVPTTFSNVPVIQANTVTAQVSFLVQCGSDRVCDSDLALTQTTITYINSSIKASEYQNALTVDATTQINITLQYSNLGEDAFDPLLTFTLPTELSSPRIYSEAAHDISCSPTSATDTSSFLCTGFQDPLSSVDGSSEITLNVQVSSGIDVGTDLVIPFAFMIRDVNRNRENATLLSNNHINVTIPVQARAVAQVRIVVQPNPTINYLGNQTGSQITSNFPSRDITYSFTKRQSSSTIHNTTLFVYLPVVVGDQEGSSRYYLYPSAISMRSSEIVCDEAGVINPENIANLVSNRRQRRHLVTRKHSTDVYGDLKRLVRQSSDAVTVENTVDCSRAQLPAACQRLTCHITDLSSSTASLTITVFVDERFFFGATETYSLVTFAEAVIHDDNLNQTGSQLTASVPITLTKEPSVGAIPIYVIVVPIVAAVLLIIILVIILYFCGFFRRKSHKQKEEEAGTEEPNANGEAKSNEKNTSKGFEDSNSEREASSITEEEHRQNQDIVTEEEDDIAKYDTKMAKYSSDDKVLSTEEQRSAEYYSTVLSSSTDI